MAATHTKAPWTVTLRPVPNDGCIGYVKAAGDIEIAVLYGADDNCQVANANLIAAAPDLLAALKTLLFAPATVRERRLIAEAEAAITKAEGRS